MVRWTGPAFNSQKLFQFLLKLIQSILLVLLRNMLRGISKKVHERMIMLYRYIQRREEDRGKRAMVMDDADTETDMRIGRAASNLARVTDCLEHPRATHPQ